MRDRRSVGPLIRVGSGRGLGLAIGLNWFQADLQSLEGGGLILTRVKVRPIMAGIGYTLASDRLSVSPSIVGGFAFNSLRVTDTGAVAGLPVEVANSWVWRPGMSIWYDINPRVALNVTVGRLMTRLHVTVLDGDGLARRRLGANTTTLHAGLAYKLF